MNKRVRDTDRQTDREKSGSLRRHIQDPGLELKLGGGSCRSSTGGIFFGGVRITRKVFKFVVVLCLCYSLRIPAAYN